MKENMKYWVVSPNVKIHDEPQSAWVKSIIQTQRAFMGWDTKNEKGRIFKKIQVGDIILIAQRQDWKPNVFLCGIASTEAVYEHLENTLSHAQNIKLIHTISKEELERLNLKFEGTAWYGDNKQIPAIYQLHPEYNPNDKLLIEKLLSKINELKINEKMESYIKLLKANRNLILTGAPGTGKTYFAKEIAKAMVLANDHKTNISSKAFEQFNDLNKDTSFVDAAWQYWRNRILSDEFNLYDFANTVERVIDVKIKSYGSYLMNFLERTSKDCYGSSKPGTAINYGIKMNDDNTSYTVYVSGSRSGKIVQQDEAILIFNTNIAPYLKSLVGDKKTFEEKIRIVQNGHDLIKASQLLTKIIVLEHTTELLSIYQDEPIERAYNYFIGESHGKKYFEKNIELVNKLLSLYKLDKTKDNLLKLASFIWHYFNKKSEEKLSDNSNLLQETYISDFIKFVQFHPSYDYSDFVEGLRPFKESGKDLSFKRVDGIFKEFCKNALKAWNEDIEKDEKERRRFIFIIDEINRAEISKVFGELFFSIDPGYRGEKGKVQTQYSNLIEDDDDVFKDGFFVPDNVYILGTMNDIDRSVESFDFAIRRRFAWLEIRAADRFEDMWRDKAWKDDSKNRMIRLNSAIEEIEGLSSAFHIGPAYFLKLDNYEGDFNKLWENHLEILLREYLRGMSDPEDKLDILKKAYNN